MNQFMDINVPKITRASRSMVARWIRHLLRLTAAHSLRLCTWWIHSAVPAGTSFFLFYRLAVDATRQGDDVAGWKSGACSGIYSLHSIKGSSEPFASSARGFSGFCLYSFNFWTIRLQKQENVSPLMPINCLINCPINSVQFVFNSCSIREQFVFKNKLMAF